MSSFQDDVEEVLIPPEAIQARIEELAQRINNDYRGQDLLLVSVLKGSLFFTADLIRHLTIPVAVDFIAISSYGESTQSSGVVRILKDLEDNIGNRHLLIVEDIIDTGLTLGYLIKNLKLRGPASIKVCALLDKPVRRILPIEADYRGFEIEDKFVVGYGLDYSHRYRHLPGVCTLKADRLARPTETATADEMVAG